MERLRNGLMGFMGIIIRSKRGILGRTSESFVAGRRPSSSLCPKSISKSGNRAREPQVSTGWISGDLGSRVDQERMGVRSVGSVTHGRRQRDQLSFVPLCKDMALHETKGRIPDIPMPSRASVEYSANDQGIRGCIPRKGK